MFVNFILQLIIYKLCVCQQLFDVGQDHDFIEEQGTDILYPNENTRNAHPDIDYRWPKGRVPFVVDTSIHQLPVLLIKQCETLKNTLALNSLDEDMNLTIFSLCYSFIGRVGGSQILSLGNRCNRKGIALHEIMHALGVFHEQNRPDRDQFVYINWDNILKNRQNNFCINDGSYCLHGNVEMPFGMTMNLPYDYSSIMHYHSTTFSKDTISPTIVPRVRSQKELQVLMKIMGQRKEMSKMDIKKLNRMYNCKIKPLGKPNKIEVDTSTYSTAEVTISTVPMISTLASTSTTSTSPTSSTMSTNNNAIIEVTNTTEYDNSSIEESTSSVSSIPTTSIEMITAITLRKLFPECKDNHSKCKFWAASGACDKFPGECLINCAFSCNNCNGDKCYNTKHSKYQQLCSQIDNPSSFMCSNKLYQIFCPESCGLCSTYLK